MVCIDMKEKFILEIPLSVSPSIRLIQTEDFLASQKQV